MSILTESEIRMKQQDLEEEIEALQTAAEVDSAPGVLDNAVTAFGNWLVAKGRKLAHKQDAKSAPTHLIKKVA